MNERLLPFNNGREVVGQESRSELGDSNGQLPPSKLVPEAVAVTKP